MNLNLNCLLLDPVGFGKQQMGAGGIDFLKNVNTQNGLLQIQLAASATTSATVNATETISVEDNTLVTFLDTRSQ